MRDSDSPVSIADLTAAGVGLRTLDAATIVRELVLRVARGEMPGVPSAHVIRLFASGAISIEGPVAADSRAVARAAHLLDTLLLGFNAPAAVRVPGALRLIVARAQSTLDLPPYPSLDSFAQALSRFASTDPETDGARARRPAGGASGTGAAAADAFAAADERHESTSSSGAVAPPSARGWNPLWRTARCSRSRDIRRARRATGLTLAEIAERTQIPALLLRQLEWGYFRNWPPSDAGRIQLVRYAYAAGLDEELVVRTAWPLIEASAQDRVIVETVEPAPAAGPSDARSVRVDEEAPDIPPDYGPRANPANEAGASHTGTWGRRCACSARWSGVAEGPRCRARDSSAARDRGRADDMGVARV